MSTDNSSTIERLLHENQSLRARLEEAEAIVRAIRQDEVDALVVSGPHGEQVHTIESVERPYRLLVENATEYAIFTLDSVGCINSWNEGAERMLGFTEAEILGLPSAVTFSQQDRMQGVPEQELRTALAEGRAMDDRLHVRKDGTIFFGSGVTTPFRNGHGTFLGFVKIMRDLTEQKRAEDEIRRLNEKLGRAMVETHHRVKNNLQMISALVDIQVEEGAGTIPIAAMNRIGHHARALAALHDLLTHQSKTGASTDNVSARAVMDKLVPLLRTASVSRNIVYSVCDVMLTVAQGTSLALLISGLVSNAVKHGAGEIELKLTEQDDVVELEVCDQGPGFCQGFDSLNSSNTGLSLINLTSNHELGGTTVFENRAGGGARVVVRFPVQHADHLPETAPL